MSGRAPAEVNAIAFDPPVSPHLAAELAGRPVRPADLLGAVRRAAQRHAAVIVEGVGGLLVPLDADGYDVRALARELALPVLIAARPTLGTINHTLLTLEAARHAGLEVCAVILTPWPRIPERLHRSNRATIERLGDVEVGTLPAVARPDRGLLSAAAGHLPLGRWLGDPRRALACGAA